MIFKFPKKKLVLDCFTFNELILQTAPIASAAKHIPDWWRKLPNGVPHPDGFFPVATMKNCIGMVDYYRHSVAMPIWTDLKIKVDGENYFWQFSDFTTTAHVHEIGKQATGFCPSHGHIKILSPWHIKTKEDVNWVWSQPTYSFEESLFDLKVLPGMFNFYFQHSSNINILVPLNQQKEYAIKQG